MKSSIRHSPTLDRPAIYRISVPGHLDQSQPVWQGDMAMAVECLGDERPVTTLTGAMDQAALQALLRRLYALGLPLISVDYVHDAG